MLAGVLAAAVVMVGCGGGDSDTAVAESSISKPEYVKKAEAICKEGSEELEADFAAFVRQVGNAKPSDALYTKLFEEVVEPNLSAELEALRELDAPEGDAGKVEEVLAAREESIAVAEGEPKAIIQDTEKVFGNSSKTAKAYGLKACASR
ncbi:MAG TPA: hypothetical protein VF245_04550 [Solirubrobacterales bacterium]